MGGHYMNSGNVAVHDFIHKLHDEMSTQYFESALKNLTFAIYLAPAQSGDRLRAFCNIMEELMVASRPKEA